VTEPDVALTDYALAVECAVFAQLVGRRRDEPRLRRYFRLFFGSIALAAVAGGTVHGFFLDADSVAASVLWRVTLLALGATAATAWGIGAVLGCSPTLARLVASAAIVEFVAYAVVVAVVTQSFGVAIANYLPPIIFLFLVFVLAYRRTRQRGALYGLVGLAVMVGGAGIQLGRLGVDPVYFNHNAVYHLTQWVAVLMMFLAARRVVPACQEDG
jgi:MFS family permease